MLLVDRFVIFFKQGSWKNLLKQPKKKHQNYNFEAIFTILDILGQECIKFYNPMKRREVVWWSNIAVILLIFDFSVSATTGIGFHYKKSDLNQL